MGKAGSISILFCFGALFLFARDGFAMHISEGILPLRWAVAWYLAALPFIMLGIGGIKKGLKKTPSFKPFLGMIGAVVFIISCMPVPVPTAGTCSHPCGTAISAILVGPIMSIFVTSIALLLQALFLAHGGLTTWGADIVSMGIVGSFAGYFAFKILRRFNASLFISAFTAGLLADWLTYTATSFELASALAGGKSVFALFMAILAAFIPTQLPLGIMEGFLTGGIIVFVYKRRPDILASLGVIKYKSQIPNPKSQINSKLQTQNSKIEKLCRVIIIGILMFVCGNLLHGISFAQNRWSGVDESVVEKVAEAHGRRAWAPFINTDQGDLLLFVFLLAGVLGGFVIGYNFRRLFTHEKKQPTP